MAKRTEIFDEGIRERIASLFGTMKNAYRRLFPAHWDEYGEMSWPVFYRVTQGCTATPEQVKMIADRWARFGTRYLRRTDWS